MWGRVFILFGIPKVRLSALFDPRTVVSRPSWVNHPVTVSCEGWALYLDGRVRDHRGGRYALDASLATEQVQVL
jgi:hypothetical protein